jgi:hypothetical protein
MNDQHEKLMKEIARRDKLRQAGRIPLLEALYDLQERHGVLPLQVEERRSVLLAKRPAKPSVPEASTDENSPRGAPFLSVVLSFLRGVACPDACLPLGLGCWPPFCLAGRAGN